jgi:hypothetical protein
MPREAAPGQTGGFTIMQVGRKNSNGGTIRTILGRTEKGRMHRPDSEIPSAPRTPGTVRSALRRAIILHPGFWGKILPRTREKSTQ